MITSSGDNFFYTGGNSLGQETLCLQGTSTSCVLRPLLGRRPSVTASSPRGVSSPTDHPRHSTANHFSGDPFRSVLKPKPDSPWCHKETEWSTRKERRRTGGQGQDGGLSLGRRRGPMEPGSGDSETKVRQEDINEQGVYVQRRDETSAPLKSVAGVSTE